MWLDRLCCSWERSAQKQSGALQSVCLKWLFVWQFNRWMVLLLARVSVSCSWVCGSLKQGVVTAICLCPAFPAATAISQKFWSCTLRINGKGRDRLCTLVYASVYYKKSSDQEARKARSSDQASFNGRIKRSSAYFEDQNSWLLSQMEVQST